MLGYRADVICCTLVGNAEAACGRIGAAPVGCRDTAVVPCTWSEVKALYGK